MEHATRLVRMLALALMCAGCAPLTVLATPAPTATASAVTTAIATPSPSTEPTRPFVSTQAPLPAPTHVRWAVDKGSADRPYLLELLYDNSAVGFRVIDAGGSLVLQFPIAGSGIFGPETCLVSAKPAGARENATWRSVDVATYQQFAADAATYRVEVDLVGGGVITVRLEDSGCRRG